MTISAALSDSANATLDAVAAEQAVNQRAYYEAQTSVDEDGNAVQRRRYEQLPPATSGAVTYRVDVYDGPSGPGYVLCALVVEGGVTYMTRRDRGPEDRPDGWRAVTGGA